MPWQSLLTHLAPIQELALYLDQAYYQSVSSFYEKKTYKLCQICVRYNMREMFIFFKKSITSAEIFSTGLLKSKSLVFSPDNVHIRSLTPQVSLDLCHIYLHRISWLDS